MSDYSVVKKIEELNLEFSRRIEQELQRASIDMQDKSRSIQAKDAFWYAFEYARCHPEAMNIQEAWQEYKSSRSNIEDV